MTQTAPQNAVQNIEPLLGLGDQWFVIFCSSEVLFSTACSLLQSCPLVYKGYASEQSASRKEVQLVLHASPQQVQLLFSSV